MMENVLTITNTKSKSVIINGDVHGKFKIFCKGKSLKIGGVIEDLIRLYLHAEGIHLPATWIVEIGIVKVLTPLVLFRAAVVVQGEHAAAIFPAGHTQANRGFAAVAANFQDRTVFAGQQRCLEQGLGLVRGQEALQLV